MVQWRVYYGDGSTYSNVDGPPESAPCTRVIAVAWYDEDGRRKICHQADYYVHYIAEKRWASADMSGLLQYLMEPGLKIVKFGREIGDLAYRNVMTKALGDLPLERGAVK